MKKINIYGDPNSDRSELFHEFKFALEYCKNQELVEDSIICCYCGAQMKIRKMSSFTGGFAYICTEYKCRKVQNIFSGKIICSPKLSLNVYFYAIYKWIENTSEKNVLINLNINKRTYQKIKYNISLFLNYFWCVVNTQKLGGEEKTVQIDETAIYHGSINESPSNINDEYSDIHG